jgi:hypothetical protein
MPKTQNILIDSNQQWIYGIDLQNVDAKER